MSPPTDSGLKGNSKKSSKFLANLKETVRSTFSSSSESSNEDKGMKRHMHKPNENPDSRSAQDEAGWAYVHQQVLVDCVPGKTPDKGHDHQGMSLEQFRAIADQDPLFCGPHRPPTDSPDAADYGDDLRVPPRNRPLSEREAAARERQYRTEVAAFERLAHDQSRRHAMDEAKKEREAATSRHRTRDELPLNAERCDRESRVYSMIERQVSVLRRPSSVYETEAEAREAQIREEGQLRAEAQLRADRARKDRRRARAAAHAEAETHGGRFTAPEDELRPESRRFIN